MNIHRNPRLASGIEEYRRIRESLLAGYPELAEDELALSDIADGESDLMDRVANLIRTAREDKVLVKGLSAYIDELCERKRRLQARAEGKLAAALQVLQAVGERRLSRPDFTATVMAPRPAAVVTDVDALPDEMCRIKREADKTRIREALDAGEAVAGACLGNGSPTLMVKTK